MQFYWLQKQHTAGDNNFDPYILYAKELSHHVLESHRAEELSPKFSEFSLLKRLLRCPTRFSLLKRFPNWSEQHLTTSAVVLGVLGFIAQFQGLRFSNWTCSVSQIIALGLATILRAWVRRGMTVTPGAVPVNNDYVLDNLALAIVGKALSDSKCPAREAFRLPGLSLGFGVASAPRLRAIKDPESKVEKNPCLAQQALNMRVRLGLITKWTGPKSQEAIILSNAIEISLERLSPELPSTKKCAVVFQVNTYRTVPNMPSPSGPNAQEQISSREEDSSQEEVKLGIMKDGNKWKVDDAQLEALLSLVSYSTWAVEQNRSQQEINRDESSADFQSSGHRTKQQSVKNSQSIGRLREKAPDLQIYDIIVGKPSPTLFCDLFWWISDAKQAFKEVETKHGSVSEVPALGFYMNDNTSAKSGMVTI